MSYEKGEWGKVSASVAKLKLVEAEMKKPLSVLPGGFYVAKWPFIVSLFQQDHFFDLNKITSLNSVHINAAGQIASIKCKRMETS